MPYTLSLSHRRLRAKEQDADAPDDEEGPEVRPAFAASLNLKPEILNPITGFKV